MNNDIMTKISRSPSIKVISDLGNEYISEGIAFEGPRDSPLGLEGGQDQLDLSGAEIDQYFEFVDEDDKLSELEGEELQQSLRLVMEDQMGRIEQRKKDQGLTPYETVLQGASAADWKKAESKRGLGYSGPPAARTEREHRQKARKAEEINQKIRQG